MSRKELTGVMGELGVCKHIEHLAKKHYIKYIHNLPYKSVRGFQQVDIAVLSPFGFWAVEVKNWDCRLFCSLRDYYWTAEYKHRDVWCRSPVQQNEGHCRYLKNITGEGFRSLVIFPDTTVLVNKLSNTIYLSEFPKVFSEGAILYSNDEIDATYAKLLAVKSEMETYMISDMLFTNLEDKQRAGY